MLWLIAGGEGVVLSLSMMPSLFDATTPATPAAASSGKQPLVRFTSPRHLSSSSPVVLGNGLFGIGLRWSWNTVVAESSERRGVGCLTLAPTLTQVVPPVVRVPSPPLRDDQVCSCSIL